MSFRASQEGLEILGKARRQKGRTKTQTPIWWQTAYASRATLRRFWERKQPIKPIIYESFNGTYLRFQQKIFLALKLPT